MAKAVLITGGAGFIGSYIVCRLCATGYRAVVLDLHPPNAEHAWLLRREGARAEFERGSVTDPAVLRRVIEHYDISDIIHLASIVNPVHLAQRPLDALNVNTLGTVEVLEAMREHRLRRLVNFSTIGVLPSVRYEPIDADHPVVLATRGPGSSFYGAAKLASEAFCWAYRQSFGTDFVTLRPSAVYGFGQQYPIYIKPLVEGAVRGERVHFNHGGEFPRDYTHAADVAQLAVLALEAPAERLTGRVFYAATGRPLVTAADVASLVREIIPGADVSVDPGLTDADRVELAYRGILDVAAAEQQLGYVPRFTDLRDGIRDYVARYRAFWQDSADRSTGSAVEGGADD